MRKKLATFNFTLCLLCLADSCVAQDDSDQTIPILESRHRLDFSLVYLDSNLDDSLNAELVYAYNFTPKTNFSVSVSYLDSRLNQEGGSGIGDTSLTFSWSPYMPISVGPWVPRRIGTGIGLVLPTGDAADGRSVDATVIAPFLGLVIPVTESLFIYPSMSYMGSFDQTITGEDLSLGVVDVGAGWVSTSGVFLNAYIAWVKDFEVGKTYLNTELSLGMSFSDNWSASIAWDLTEFFIPGTIVDFKGHLERQFAFSLHYNF